VDEVADEAVPVSRRTFVAVDSPASIRRRISKLCTGLPGARWSNPEQYHITLRFLGKTRAEALPVVEEALAGLAARSFELTLAEFGTFPASDGRRPPRTLWVRPSENAALSALQTGVEAAVRRATGIAEEKAFRPHVTVARFRKPPAPGDLARWLDAAKAFGSEPFRVESFRFYASELTPNGAVHSVLADFGLS
jgi:2'-5' RNA ligase